MYQNKVVILVADDDEDDQMLTKEAFEENRDYLDIRFVNDGVELLEYLRGQNKYSRAGTAPLPALILLDLNMPRMDGKEALKEIKIDPVLRKIPVVVLTTSSAEPDILKAYEMGVNSFIKKPVTFTEFVKIADTLERYWLEIVELP